MLSRALLFGLSGSVLLSSRVPNLVVAIARRWLALAAHCFSDVFRIVDFKDSEGSAERYFDKLMVFLGKRFDPEKQQLSLSRFPMLGNMEQVVQLGASVSFKVAAKPERLQAITDDVQGCLKSCMVASGEAASLRGKQLHISATRPGRTGRLPRFFLRVRADV